MKELNLKITLEEANLILEALGNMPFTRVYTLISKIQSQAEEQINDQDNASPDATKSND